MKSDFRLLYKSNMTYFPTSLPVYFYGMPDGHIYLIYARYIEIEFYRSNLEFIFAILEDFTFDNSSDQIYTQNFIKIDQSVFKERVDMPDQRIIVMDVLRNIDSYTEAQSLLKLIFRMNVNSPAMVQV